VLKQLNHFRDEKCLSFTGYQKRWKKFSKSLILTGFVSFKMLCEMRLSRESFKFTILTLKSPQLVITPADPDANHFFIHLKAFPSLSTTVQLSTGVLSILDTADPGRLVPCFRFSL